jgi:hypothetical protein
VGVPDNAELNAHELLLRLAGRLSDDQLRRFRDWLASGATLRGREGLGEVRCAWRHAPDGRTHRVVLVTAVADQHRLAGELQRMLRALGEHEPCVEVLAPDFDLPPYHRLALDVSELLCFGAADLAHA